MQRYGGKLSGKVALVTGAAKGIGASIAQHLAAEGATVIVNYAKSESDAEKVVGLIEKGGGRAIAMQADVSNLQDVQRLFGEIKKQNQHLDILVNNAGIFEFKPFQDITAEHFHAHFNLNVLGLIYVTQEAIKIMNDGGSIINISSIASKRPGKANAVYAATKASVDAITQSLSLELGPRQIRVNSLNPGMVETEGFKSSGLEGSEFHKDALKVTPMGRIAQPSDIAKAAVFYAGSDSGWISGENVIIAGGRR